MVATPELLRHDALADFSAREVTLLGRTRTVFVAGAGPAVIVMAELPGITPHVLRFARWVRDAGFTVYLPRLFGDPGRPPSFGYGMSSSVRVCMSAEFHAFRANSSGGVAPWLRALAKLAHEEAGGKGVGAIGMCFTGNFALTMMLEPAMLAPVLCQPSLPVTNAAGMHIAPDELRQVKERLEREDLTVRAYRFEGDRLCRAARFNAYQEALGDRFVGTVLRDADANPDAPVMKMPHSVVTLHLIDEAGQPTRAAVDEIIAFFRLRLRAAPT